MRNGQLKMKKTLSNTFATTDSSLSLSFMHKKNMTKY